MKSIAYRTQDKWVSSVTAHHWGFFAPLYAPKARKQRIRKPHHLSPATDAVNFHHQGQSWIHFLSSHLSFGTLRPTPNQRSRMHVVCPCQLERHSDSGLCNYSIPMLVPGTTANATAVVVQMSEVTSRETYMRSFPVTLKRPATQLLIVWGPSVRQSKRLIATD